MLKDMMFHFAFSRIKRWRDKIHYVERFFGITSTSFFDYVIAHQNLVGNSAFVYIRMTIK